MKKTFICSCDTHSVDITFDKPTKKFPHYVIGIEIWETNSQITGKPYKHKRWMADVMLMDLCKEKGRNDLSDFIKFVNKISPKEE